MSDFNDNDFNVSEIREQLRSLKLVLKRFEVDFQQQHNRKPIKADLEPERLREYTKYHKLKSTMNKHTEIGDSMADVKQSDFELAQSAQEYAAAISDISDNPPLQRRTQRPPSINEIQGVPLIRKRINSYISTQSSVLSVGSNHSAVDDPAVRLSVTENFQIKPKKKVVERITQSVDDIPATPAAVQAAQMNPALEVAPPPTNSAAGIIYQSTSIPVPEIQQIEAKVEALVEQKQPQAQKPQPEKKKSFLSKLGLKR